MGVAEHRVPEVSKLALAVNVVAPWLAEIVRDSFPLRERGFRLHRIGCYQIRGEHHCDDRRGERSAAYGHVDIRRAGSGLDVRTLRREVDLFAAARFDEHVMFRVDGSHANYAVIGRRIEWWCGGAIVAHC